MMNFENTLSFAKKMDNDDVLKHFRQQFIIPTHHNKEVVYFTGNSLGLQPKTTLNYIQQELNDWGSLGVEGHFKAANPWMHYHEMFAQPLAAIVGAKETEVVAMNQLTVNLHLLMVSFYKPTAQRYKIICEAKAFPSDQYAIESQIKFHGFNYDEALIEVAPRAGEHCIRLEDILQTIETHKNEVALVLFGGVNYYTGQVFNIEQITKAAHAAGAYCGFDLAHAVGNIPLQLHTWNVDFACWCSYKYLNSGPGGVAGIYIHEKHHQAQLPQFSGWWGYVKDTRFKMEKGFKPIPTAEAWQLSNAPVLSMAAHKAALDIFMQAGLSNLYSKAKQLSSYLLFIIEEINKQWGKQVIEVITPTNNEERGCQVSMLMLQNGKTIFNALMQQGVVVDWREPNVIRAAPVPLYNSFEDVFKFGQIISEVLQHQH
jgi:kynureninase